MKHTRKITSLLLAMVMMLSMIPMAYAATYEYEVEGGSLKFDPTTGTITDCDSSVYSADIPSEIYGVPVTAIGQNAFAFCKKLSRVTIPSSVTTIGYSAFSACSNLTSVTIPNSVIELEKRGDYGSTFSNCSSLEFITIPGSIKIIPRCTFLGCTKLKEVTLQEGVEKIERNTFGGGIGINRSMEEITLPNSLKEISTLAFANCEVLEKVTFGTGLRRIDDNAFSGCKNLYDMYFTGDAPSATDKMINKFADGFKIYYPEGASGWTTPTWNGYITESYRVDGSTTAPSEPTTPSEPVTPVQPQNVTTAGQQTDGWALELVNEAIAANLMPNSLGNDLRGNITREQFAGVAVKLYEAMSGTVIPTPALSENHFTDTSSADVRKAYSMGLVSGTSDTTFSPNSSLNREQAAVMLSNVYKALGGVITARNPGAFSDDRNISSWAKTAVYFMSENGIISGVGNNRFGQVGS